MTESGSDDIEEQEVLLYMDFGSSLSSNELDNPNLDVKIIGIDTDTPIAELNGKLLQGTYDYCIGTNVFFEKDNDPPPLDPIFDINPEQMYKYMTKTTKVLHMKRLFVQSKSAETDETKEESLEELRSRLEVKMSYEEALNLLLPPGAHPPRRITPNEDDMDTGCDNDSENDDDDPES